MTFSIRDAFTPFAGSGSSNIPGHPPGSSREGF